MFKAVVIVATDVYFKDLVLNRHLERACNFTFSTVARKRNIRYLLVLRAKCEIYPLNR